jgi:glycosyltransferase involved in cell wall biosynthesis
MKTTFIVDKPQSALWLSAKQRVELTGGKVICASHYSSPNKLLNFLVNRGHGKIIFSWRTPLIDFAKIQKLELELNTLRSTNFIFLLIPDYIGLDNKFLESEKFLIELCDGYLVTNQELFANYSLYFPNKPPMSVLHDLPNWKEIEKIRLENEKPINTKRKVIWVGNSSWGKRQGFKDHKGLHSVIKPLIQEIRKSNNCCEIKYIDSKEGLLSHSEVLKEIRSCDILLQTSHSEGTGLPAIEALGLGTNVISTQTGIAPEIFKDEKSQNIVERDYRIIHKRIHSLELKSELMNVKLFYKYLEIAKGEDITIPKKSKFKFQSNKSIFGNLEIRIIWYLRFIKNSKFLKINLR